jgi:hypothetical protein
MMRQKCVCSLFSWDVRRSPAHDTQRRLHAAIAKNFPVGDGSKLNFCRGHYKSEMGENRRVEAWVKQEKGRRTRNAECGSAEIFRGRSTQAQQKSQS